MTATLSPEKASAKGKVVEAVFGRTFMGFEAISMDFGGFRRVSAPKMAPTVLELRHGRSVPMATWRFSSMKHKDSGGVGC